jgi:NTP pyrophosphatase (non-canonical NTP hydrolase)
MMLDEYQSNARKTAALDGGLADRQLAVLALGLAGEAGELLELAMEMAIKASKTADYIKKVIGHSHTLDRDRVIKELGDNLWYNAMIADLLHIPLSEVARVNNEKLANRYPNGFESEKSINRTE